MQALVAAQCSREDTLSLVHRQYGMTLQCTCLLNDGQPLMELSMRQVEELHEFSARARRADPRRPRCFRSVLLCDPSPALNVTTGDLRPFAAAQWVRRPACMGLKLCKSIQT